MTRFRHNVSANVLANVWSTALALALTPVYVNLLGVESYGLIGFYGSWVALLGILDTGISATAVREVAWYSARQEDRWNIPPLLRSLEVAYWTIVTVVGVALLAASWWLGGRWFVDASLPQEAIRTALMLMVVSLVLQVPSGLYAGGLMGLQRQVECSAIVALFGTARGMGAVLVLLFVERDIRVFFLWQIALSALQTFTIRWSLLRHVRGAGPAWFSRPMLRSVRRFAGQTSLITALSLVLIQSDKLILSRIVSLELFGLYMLAWTIASGLFRVATPVLQAFSPRFTVLVSEGAEAALGSQVRLACQLTSALLLPPAALLVLLPRPIVAAWTGDDVVAAAVAPLVAVMTVGTVLSACAYPALNVLYSRKRLGPVIALHAGAIVGLLPVTVLAAMRFGAIGAAWCWSFYGLVMYLASQVLGLKGLPGARFVSRVLEDLVAPALASFAVAWIAMHFVARVEGGIETVLLLGLALIAGWGASFLACRHLFKSTADAFKWKLIDSPWSA